MKSPLAAGRQPVAIAVVALVVVALVGFLVGRGTSSSAPQSPIVHFGGGDPSASASASSQPTVSTQPTAASQPAPQVGSSAPSPSTAATTSQAAVQPSTSSTAPATPQATASGGSQLGAGLAPGRTLSGVAGAGTTDAAAFGDLRRKPVEVVVNYASVESWSAMDDLANNGLLYRGTPASVHRVFSLPLIPSDHSSTLADGAAGKDDGYFRTFAQQLVQGNQARATIRLGWEMTGDWFAWNGQKDPADWVAAYRSAVTAMRSVPGQQFTFDWNVSLGFADPEPLYPGDAYVDIIGADHYDVSFSSNFSPTDHQKVWQNYLDQPKGLTWLAAFATAHGKRMSFPEWGLSNRCDGHGGNDDPYFIQAMHDWIAQHDVAYEAYYESHDAGVCATFDLKSGKFPQGAALYRKLFGDGA
ncbi:hypothetical protein acdb102_18210 [Acidothermaceae bacterium B102]|nr:hypothetical protein acdb102_18210 [Acidothermaceae bacterium B102]